MKISDTSFHSSKDSKPATDAQNVSADVQKAIDQQRMVDQQALSDVVKTAESTDVLKDTEAQKGGKEGYKPTFGQGNPCASRGCDGSHSCGGGY